MSFLTEKEIQSQLGQARIMEFFSREAYDDHRHRNSQMVDQNGDDQPQQNENVAPSNAVESQEQARDDASNAPVAAAGAVKAADNDHDDNTNASEGNEQQPPSVPASLITAQKTLYKPNGSIYKTTAAASQGGEEDGDLVLEYNENAEPSTAEPGTEQERVLNERQRIFAAKSVLKREKRKQTARKSVNPAKKKKRKKDNNKDDGGANNNDNTEETAKSSKASKKEPKKKSSSTKAASVEHSRGPPDGPLDAKSSKASKKEPKTKSSSTKVSSVELSRGPPDEPLDGGWPQGWIKIVVQRQGGNTKDRLDKYWLSPLEQRKFRSMTEVKKFLKALERKGGDEKEAYKIFKSIEL